MFGRLQLQHILDASRLGRISNSLAASVSTINGETFCSRSSLIGAGSQHACFLPHLLISGVQTYTGTG